jgi:hypothetical protein
MLSLWEKFKNINLSYNDKRINKDDIGIFIYVDFNIFRSLH